jgi:oligogalacturonide lyase
MDLSDKRLVQLTDEPEARVGNACLDVERDLVYYWSGSTLKSVAVDGRDEREYYTCPEGFIHADLTLSACGRYLSFAYVEKLPLSTQTGVIYSSQAERQFQHPRSVLMRVDVETGQATALYGETEWYTHVNASTVDPHVVMFCHEGKWTRVQRMWICRADTHEVWPLLKTRLLLEQCGHEYFTASGKVAVQYAERRTVRDEEWRHANVVLNPDGSNERRYWYDGWQPAHVQTANDDETLMVGDCGQRERADDEPGQSMMALLRLVDDRTEITPLCRHDTSWKSHNSHPHPIFWPDDRWVVFNSDRGGRCNVYRAEVAL